MGAQKVKQLILAINRILKLLYPVLGLKGPNHHCGHAPMYVTQLLSVSPVGEVTEVGGTEVWHQWSAWMFWCRRHGRRISTIVFLLPKTDPHDDPQNSNFQKFFSKFRDKTQKIFQLRSQCFLRSQLNLNPAVFPVCLLRIRLKSKRRPLGIRGIKDMVT